MPGSTLGRRAQPWQRAAPALWFTLLFVHALWLRSANLHLGELNNDELATALWASAPNWKNLLQQLQIPDEGNSLGYPALLRVWGFFGRSELWLRAPSLIAGALLPPLFYLFARKRASHAAAALPAALLSTSVLLVDASRTARCYSILALVLFLSWRSLWSLLKNPRSVSARMGWILCGACALWLHHYSLFYLATMVGIGLLHWKTGTNKPSHWAILLFAPFFLYLPGVPHLVHQMKHGPVWLPPLSGEMLLHTLGEVYRFMPDGFVPYVLALGLLLGWIQYLRKRLWQEAVITLIPPALAMAASLLYRPVIAQHYLIALLPLSFLAIPAGIQGIRHRPLRGAALLTLATTAVISTQGAITALAVPSGFDLRATAAWIDEHRNECSEVVFSHPGIAEKIAYYLPEGFRLLSWRRPTLDPPYWLVLGVYAPSPKLEAAAAASDHMKRNGTTFTAVCIRTKLSLP